MSASAPLLLAALLAIAPVGELSLELDAEGLDPAAVEAGLRVRVGDELDRWSIRVELEAPTRYRVELRQAGVEPITRLVTLAGPSDEDRSRELASTLALIIDEAGTASVVVDAPRRGGDEGEEEDSETRAPAPTESLALPLGFVTLEAQIELGPPRDLDPSFGLGLGGGAWLFGDHLQPRARIAWSHSRAGELEVHQLRAGIGLAGGAALGRLWLGVLVLPTLEWTRAREISTSSSWSGGGELSLIAQYRRPQLVLGLRTGIETSFPAPRAVGTREVIRWGHVRWLCVLEIGFGIASLGAVHRP